MQIAATNRKTLKTWFRNKSTASKTFKEMAVFSTESQRAIQDTHLIPFSALQHYIFCLHQCALIHNEQAWAENYLTTQEKALYERGDSGEQETCKDVRFERAVHALAGKLGICSVLDRVELETKTGSLKPVECKRGKPKPTVRWTKFSFAFKACV